MVRRERRAGALVLSGMLAALAAAVWLAGREQRIPVLLVTTRGTDRQWLATVRSALRAAYGERLAVYEASWTLDPPVRGNGSSGSPVSVARLLELIPAVPGNPLVAVVSNVDLRGGPDPDAPWIHGIGLPQGRMVVSVRRVAAERRHETGPDLGLVAAHEFGHVLGFGHCRDRSLMAYVGPGETPAADRSTLSAEDGFELPPRLLVRAWVPPGSSTWLSLLAVPLLALPGASLVCAAWHGLRTRFGSARAQPVDLATALVLLSAGVAVSHYGWALLLPAMILLQAIAGRLLPGARGAWANVAFAAPALVLGAAATLADLGYLTPGVSFDPAGFDPEVLATLPGAVLSLLLLRASRAEPVEGRRPWGSLPLAAAAALLGAITAGWASSLGAALGGAALGFALIRVFSVRVLPVDRPGSY